MSGRTLLHASLLLAILVSERSAENPPLTSLPEEPEANGPTSCVDADRCDHVTEHVTSCEEDGQLKRTYCYGAETIDQALVESDCTEIEESEPASEYCSGSVSRLCPRVGPVSGGTHVFLWGAGFSNISVSVRLGLFDCQVVFSNESVIECVTVPVHAGAAGSALSLQLTYKHFCTLRASSVYAYDTDPVIRELAPLATIRSGGTTLTVHGSNMDSVTKPLINIHTKNTNNLALITEVCEVFNAFIWLCPAPNLLLASSSVDTPSDDVISANRDALFSLGFSLDGVSTYENLSASLPDYGHLHVVHDPILHTESKAIPFHPAWPYGQTYINIQGRFFTADTQNYSVSVGSDACVILSVTSSRILCSPPDTLPSGSYTVEVRLGNWVNSSLSLSCDRSPWTHRTLLVVVVGAGSALILVIIVVSVMILMHCRRRRKHAGGKEDAECAGIEKYMMGEYLDPNVDLMRTLRKSLQKTVKSCLLSETRYREGAVIREGSFSLVSLGVLLDTKGNESLPVTIKSFKEKGAPFREVMASIESAMLFRGLRHNNILPVLSVAIVKNSPKFIYPHTEHGDLKQFLAKIKEKKIIPELRELLQLCQNAAEAMQYLLKQGFAHGDLSARNCRVDRHGLLKVCDNALSRDLYPGHYMFLGEKQISLPLRWMPPETIHNNTVANEKTDVWSFGVLMWEIITLGELPYGDMDDKAIIAFLKQGNRLARPYRAPLQVYTLMTHCWSRDPKRRPMFDVICRKLRTVSSSERKQSCGTMKPASSVEVHPVDTIDEEATTEHTDSVVHSQEDVVGENGQSGGTEEDKELNSTIGSDVEGDAASSSDSGLASDTQAESSESDKPGEDEECKIDTRRAMEPEDNQTSNERNDDDI